MFPPTGKGTLFAVSLAIAAFAADAPHTEKVVPLHSPAIRSVFPLGGQAGQQVTLEIEGEFLEHATLQCECKDLTTRIESINPLQVIAKIEVSVDAVPGPRTLYLKGQRGHSNRFLFRVTKWNSVVETEPNDTLKAAQQVPNPSIVEGRVARLIDTDFFRFHAAAGERIALNVMAARSKAPGFVSLALLTAEGRELAHNNAGIGPDPFLIYQVPEEGEYVVALTARRFADFFTVLKDDQLINWQYQLAIGRSPLLWSVFPMGGQQGTHVAAELRADFVPADAKPVISGSGVSLTMSPIEDDCACRYRLDVAIAADAAPGTRLLSLPDDSGNLTPLGFSVGTEPEVLEVDAKPQKVDLPITINGRISTAAEHDAYRLKVNQDDVVTFELNARELGSRMADPQIALLRAQGDMVEFADDLCRKCSTLQNTVQKKRSLDPFLTHAFISASANDADAAGEYDLVVLDNSSRGDPTRTYRLTMRKAQPDFTTGVLADHVMAALGGPAKVPVGVSRLEGFNGSISVAPVELPAGWHAEPLVINAGNESADLLIRREEGSATEGRIELRASGKDGERELVRIAEAPPLINEDGAGFLEATRTITEVAFVPRPPFHLKVEERPGGLIMNLKDTAQVEIPLTIERRDGFKAPLTFHAENLPKGMVLRGSRIEGEKTIVTLGADPSLVKPQRYRVAISAVAGGGPGQAFDSTPTLNVQVK